LPCSGAPTRRPPSGPVLPAAAEKTQTREGASLVEPSMKLERCGCPHRSLAYLSTDSKPSRLSTRPDRREAPTRNTPLPVDEASSRPRRARDSHVSQPPRDRGRGWRRIVPVAPGTLYRAPDSPGCLPGPAPGPSTIPTSTSGIDPAVLSDQSAESPNGRGPRGDSVSPSRSSRSRRTTRLHRVTTTPGWWCAPHRHPTRRGRTRRGRW